MGLTNKRNFALYNLAKSSERRLFFQLLNELCNIIKEPKSKNGRPPVPLRDMVFCSCLKLYRKSSGRPLKGELELAQGANYISRVPHFNTIKDFFNAEGTFDLLSRLLTITAMPLADTSTTASLDSSGFAGYSYERWQRIKWDGKKDKKNYLKAHVVIDPKTHVILTAEITPGNFSDVKQAPALILKAQKNFPVKKFLGDKAYSSHMVYRVLESLKIIPIIPFKVNAKKESENAPQLWNDAYRYFKSQRGNFDAQYHQRSQSETTFSQIKMRLGEILLSKNYKSQRNELMLKLICHNILTLIMEIHKNKIQIDFTGAEARFKETEIPKDYMYQNAENVKNEDY